jgi:hypothetical protein
MADGSLIGGARRAPFNLDVMPHKLERPGSRSW